MSWSYSRNPADSELDLIRYTIGDVDPENPELENEEIQYEIDTNKNETGGTLNEPRVSLTLLKRIRARYKSMNDEKVGDADIKWSQRYKQINDLIRQIEDDIAKEGIASAYGGGISRTDKRGNNENTDTVKPSFTRNFGNNERNPYSTSSSVVPPI